MINEFNFLRLGEQLRVGEDVVSHHGLLLHTNIVEIFSRECYIIIS